MPEEHKTVFISYRRDVASFIARAIFQDLRANGYDVFMDVENIDSGQFDRIILNQIEARAHFVLILTPGSVERCAEPGDWLRREIEYAMDKQRNIVPLLIRGFTFNGTEEYLTGKLDGLSRFNGLNVPHDYFDEAMARLRTRFLKQPVYGEIKPAPASDQAEVERKVAEVVAQPEPTEQQLTAEDYFRRAYNRERQDYDGKIADYSEAIRLNPQYTIAYYNRAIARRGKGDIDGATADYAEAIHLNPQYVNAYYSRAIARRRKGDVDGAIADYDEVIRLDPQYASAYNNRGEIYFAISQFDKALEDFQQANNLHPAYNMTLGGLAITYDALGREEDAQRMWCLLIAQDKRYLDADWVGKELNWAEPLVEAARKLIAEL